MEFLVAIALLVIGLWLLAWSRRSSVPRRTSPDSNPTPIELGSRTITQERLDERPISSSAEESWIPPGRAVSVAGYTIPGGMLYVGKRLTSVAGYGVEPALINTSLPVNRSNPNRTGEGMPYWPSYSSIPPTCRAAYLEWLAAGRRDPSAYIGYVFLYFYGLERRVFAEALHSEQAKQDVQPVIDEVEHLLQVYGSNASFRRYATQFADLAKAVIGDGELKPPMERAGYELPASLRIGIGRLIAAGSSLPPEWALGWYLTHPDTALRTPAKRCPEEFQALFRSRYAREFGEGLRVKPNRSKLKIEITPASASFGGRVELKMDLPDIGALTAPVAKLRQIGDHCTTDLDAYSRWIGRNAEAPKTIAAVALLPPELAATYPSQEAQTVWHWLETTIGQDDRVICRADDLLQQCPSLGEGKLAKSESVLLAQLLEKRGYGIEPDVRFGGIPLAPSEAVVIFKLPPNWAAIASSRYSAATVLLHLAVAVSSADGSISSSEQTHLEGHMQRALGLSDAERVRLSAHLAWLLESRPSMSGLKKRLEPLETRQRSAMAAFLVGVAGADGQISPDEVRTLGKIYPMLGLAADDVYGHVHAMAAGAAPESASAEPVTIISAQPTTSYAIPPRPTDAGTVYLDMAAVQAKLDQSTQISAILADIFTEDEEAGALPAKTTVSVGKVPRAYGILLSRLAAQTEWSRAEFERLAGEYRLLPDGAIDVLNEAAFEHVGGPVLEGEDPLYVDAAMAQQLLA